MNIKRGEMFMFRKGYQYKMFRGLSNMILGFVFLIGSNFLAIEEK